MCSGAELHPKMMPLCFVGAELIIPALSFSAKPKDSLNDSKLIIKPTKNKNISVVWGCYLGFITFPEDLWAYLFLIYKCFMDSM